MACAKKCDRCGKLYEQYNSKNDRKNPNGIMALNLDSQGRYFTHSVLDLCPDCMKEFQDWLKEVKQMERLTKRLGNKETVVFTQGKYEETIPAEMTVNETRIVLKKLCDYEDLEEQGLLVRLPCKVGEGLYCIVNGEVKKLKVHSFGVSTFGITYIECKYVDRFKIARFVGEVNKNVFLTREEAEKKLEEMKK